MSVSPDVSGSGVRGRPRLVFTSQRVVNESERDVDVHLYYSVTKSPKLQAQSVKVGSTGDVRSGDTSVVFCARIQWGHEADLRPARGF